MPSPDPRVTWPGEHDVVADVDNTTIESAIVTHTDFCVTIAIELSGGFGRWWSDGEWHVFEPGDPDAGVTSGSLTASFWKDNWDEGKFSGWVEFFVNTVRRWEAEKTPLHLVWSQDRMGAMIEDEIRWLPLPTNS